MVSSSDRAFYLLFLSLTFGLPLLVSPWGYDNAILVKESFLLFVAGALLLLLFLQGTAQGCLHAKITPLDIPALSLAVLAALSLASAVNLPAALYRLVFLLAGISLFFVATRARMDRAWIETFAKASVGAGLFVAVYAFIQSLGLDPFGRTDPFSTLSNPNYAAEYLASIIPLSLVLAISSQEPWEKYFFRLSALVFFVGVLFIRARGAAVGLLVAVGVLILLLRRKREELRREVRHLLPLAALAVIAAGLFGVWFLSRFAGPDGTMGALESYASSLWAQRNLGYRVVFYRDTLSMILENPVLGVGIGNFEFAYPRYRAMPESLDPSQLVADHALNDYLELGAELGTGGLIALIWLLWAFFRSVWRRRPFSLLGIGYGCSVAAHAVNSLFASGLYTPVPLAAFWLSMGFAVRLQKDAVPAEGQTSGPLGRKPPFWAALVAVTALCALLCAAAWPLIGDTYLLRGRRLLAGGWANQAIPVLERAARLAPTRVEAQSSLAHAYFLSGRQVEAVAILVRYLQYDPYNFRIYYLMGEYLEQAGNAEGALRAYERARGTNRFYSKPLLRIGVIREGRGDVAGALEAYRQALRLNPGFAEAANNLAILLSAQGRVDEAIQVWEEGAKANTGDLVIAQNLAAAYWKKGEREKALSWESQARRLRAEQMR